MSKDKTRIICETCYGFDRERPAILTVCSGLTVIAVCDLCAMALIQQIDAGLNSWSLMTGTPIGIKQGATKATKKQWSDLGIYPQSMDSEGISKSDCPNCGKPMAVLVNLDDGTAECRVCREFFTFD